MYSIERPFKDYLVHNLDNLKFLSHSIERPFKNYLVHNLDNLKFLSLANVFNENTTSIFEKLPSKLCRKFDIHIPVQIFFSFFI